MERRDRRQRITAVLFTDIVTSTEVAAEMGDRRWRELLGRHHRIVRGQIKRFGGREQDTAGDGFFATFDVPADAVRCAVACVEAVRELGIEIRAGVNFGEVEQVDGKPGGLVVHAGARVMSLATAGQVLVSSAAHDLLPGAAIEFDDLGLQQLKGILMPVRVFAVRGLDRRPLPPPMDPEAARVRRDTIEAAAPRRRRALLVAGAVSLLAVAVVAVVLTRDGSTPAGRSRAPSPPAPGSVVRVDPDTGALHAVQLGPPQREFIDLGRTLAAGLGAVWLVRDGVVEHIDPVHGDARPPVPLPGQPESVSYSVTTAYGSVWALSEQALYRVNPGDDTAEVVVRFPRLDASAPNPHVLATGGGNVWVGTASGTLTSFDPQTGEDRTVDTGAPIDSIAGSDDGVWTLDEIDDTISEFDTTTMRRIDRAELSEGASSLTVDEAGDVWTLSVFGATVTDVTTKHPYAVGTHPAGIVAGLGAIWVGDEDGILRRIDATTGAASEFRVGSPIDAVAVDEAAGTVWVDVGAA